MGIATDPTGAARRPSRATTRVAVAYVRRSTDRQEQSIPDQKKAIAAYAAENALSLTRYFVDDAVSGTSTTRRRAFQELIAEAQRPEHDFSYVIVFDVKRFGRVDNDEAGYYRHILKSHGVEVLYVSENFSGDATDDLLRPVKQWQAREESKDLSRVTIRGLLSKVEGGWWMGGAPPYGYDLRYETDREPTGEFLFIQRFLPDGAKELLDESGRVMRRLARGERINISKRDRARLVPSSPDRVAVVQRMFRLSAEENKGFRSIAEALNQEGIPTPRGPSWARIYNGLWTASTIRAILVSPLYVGDMVWNRRTDARFHKISKGRAVERREAYGARLVPNAEEDWIIVRDAHPPLVDRRLFEQARVARESRPTAQRQRGKNPRVTGGWKGKRARFLLSGLLECGRCGGRYEGCRRTKGRRRTDGSAVQNFYYGCGSYIRRGRTACEFGPIDQVLLEGTIVRALVAWYGRYLDDNGRLLAETVQGIVGPGSQDLTFAQERAQADLKALDGTIANLLDNLTASNREYVDQRLSTLGAEREGISRRIEELRRMALSAGEIHAITAEVLEFVRGLEFVLAKGTPEERIRTVRRCVDRIRVGSENAEAIVRVRAVPSTRLESEVVEVPVRL